MGPASGYKDKNQATGKFPILIENDSKKSYIESAIICRYLMRRYSECGPSFTPSSLEAETKSNLITQLHDLYITSIQSAMYRPTPPWGPFMTRKDAQDEII